MTTWGARESGRGLRKSVGALVAAVAVASLLTVATASPPAAAATNTTTSAAGCGTNLHVGVLDAPLLVASMMVQNGSFTIPGDQFNCVLSARELLPRFGFVLAGGAKNLRVTLQRVSGCLIVCSPLPGPHDIKVTVSGAAGGCLGFMINVTTTTNPNAVRFQCLAIVSDIGATIYTGLDVSGGLSTMLSCPKVGVTNGRLSWPRFETQSWSVVSGSPGSVNGNAPLALVSGEIVSDFVGKFVNPLILNLISRCAGAGIGAVSQPVQVGVATT